MLSEWEVLENAFALSASARFLLGNRQLVSNLKEKFDDVSNIKHTAGSNGGNRKRKGKTPKHA
jgi:tRNA C32,U32 (ribose-2'-O)-methylase TrmJ